MEGQHLRAEGAQAGQLGVQPCPVGDRARVSGVEQTVAELYELWRAPVYRYLIAVLGDAAVAEELTQEVFVRLFNHLKEGNSIRNARAWIFRVAHNLAGDQRDSRVSGYTVWPAGCEQGEDPASNAEEKVLAQERCRRVRSALARLSPQERHCLELRAEGLRYREIAEALGIRVPTVQTFLARAVGKLKRGCEYVHAHA